MTKRSDSTHFLSTDEQQAYSGLLSAAFDAARDFDGSEVSLQKVVDAYDVADQFVRARTGEQRDMSLLAEFERAYAGQAGFFPHSIGEMLSDTTAHFYRDLKDDVFAKLKAGGAAIVESDRVFVPTEGGALFDASTENPRSFKIRTEPRLAWLVEDLKAIGIYTDDLIVHVGTVRPNMVRQSPYVVIDIPRLNRQIAVCDQVGEATFVSNEILDPKIYETYTKDVLKTLPQISVVELRSRESWRAGIAEALTTNAVQPKQNVQVIAANPPKRPSPLTTEMIVERAIAYHADPQNHGKWPTKISGSEWAAIHMAIRNRGRSLSKANLPDHVIGLTTFLEWQGFTISLLSATKKLTVAGIVEKAKAYQAAPENNGELPKESSSVEWNNISTAIRIRGRGLGKENLPDHVKGLASFLEWQSLKIALASPEKNLTVIGILRMASAYKADPENLNKWPTGDSSGEWRAINEAINGRGRGLDQENLPDHVKGITSLLEWKKLAISNISKAKHLTVVEIVQKAQAFHDDPNNKGRWPTCNTNREWANINTALCRRSRGLDKEDIPDYVMGVASFLQWKGFRTAHISSSKRLTVAIILEKVKAFQADPNNNGELPTQQTDDEWRRIGSAICARTRGLAVENLPDHVKGLPSFLEWQGLTISRLSETKKLTVASIIEKAKAYQADPQNEEEWPNSACNKEWANIHAAIASRGRGLDAENLPDHVTGVVSFLEWQGLTISRFSPANNLTVAGIVEKAKAYQADPANNGQWPHENSGPEWNKISGAIQRRGRGLDQENLPDHVKGLTSLLAEEGLTVSYLGPDRKLTVEGIFERIKAWKADPANNGQWPKAKTSKEWASIDGAIGRGARGIDRASLPDDVKGLQSFIKWQLSLQAAPEASAGNSPGFVPPEPS